MNWIARKSKRYRYHHLHAAPLQLISLLLLVYYGIQEVGSSSSGSSKGKAPSSHHGHARDVIRSRAVVVSTSCYGLIAMTFIILDETLPLHAKLPPQQGTSAASGIILIVIGSRLGLFDSVWNSPIHDHR